VGRILAISSQVVRGHVGLSAIVPALQRLGHEVLPVPTIVLSNHPGHAKVAGAHTDAATIAAMIEAIAANGWLARIDMVLTGYLPTRAHVLAVEDAVLRVRAASPGATVLCDPVMGDDPKGLYIARDVAEAIRERLVPQADIITPNRFELSWLSGRDVGGVDAAIQAARTIGRVTVATSIPDGDGFLANVLAQPGRAFACRVAKRTGVPHGTGDLLSGIFAGHLLRGERHCDALGYAAGAIQHVLQRGAEDRDLSLVITGAGDDWSAAPALVCRDA
jgi:pyridoxine kinase